MPTSTRGSRVAVLMALAAAFALAARGAEAGEAPDPAALKAVLQKHAEDKLHATQVDEIEVGQVAGALVSTTARATVQSGDAKVKGTWEVVFKWSEGKAEGEPGQWILAKVAADPLYLRAMLQKHVDGKLRGDLVDEAIDPGKETPIRVRIREVELGQADGDALKAKARVLIVGTKPAVTGEWDKVTFRRIKGLWTVDEVRAPAPDFGLVNYAVLFIYLAAMLAIGWWTSRFIKDTRGFFIAEGRLNFVIVGISILTAYLSALTMMAIPGVAFKKLDWLFAAQLPFLIFTAFVITQFVLKRYRDSGIISVYAYLEQRIHVSARLLASLSFIVFSIGRMGLVLYLPALAFSMVAGANLLTTIIVMGVVVTIYTVMGGMEAVIWTDFVQAIVMVAGAVISVLYIMAEAGGHHFMEIANAHHKFRYLATRGDLTSLITIFLVLETIFQTIRIYGTQQDIAQRYMTTTSTRKANFSVWIAILGFIPFCLLFFFIGTALFVYYQVKPDTAVPAMLVDGKAAAIYPYFVASRLPVVVAGLVIAAIFAAAMSSIDACMNASSTVCVQDFYRRFRREGVDDRHYLNVARGLTVLWGALATVAAILMMNIRTVQIYWGKVMGVSTNGILGLMALAFLRKPVRAWAAIVGFFSSYACLFAMMYFLQVKPTVIFTYPVKEGHTMSYLLWPVFGNLTCFVVAIALDRIFANGQGPEQPAA